MWVIFEGLDKAGKGTLEREFLKAVNYEHIIIDRGPVGYMTFDEIFKRRTVSRDETFIHKASKIMASGDFMIVYCFADKNVIDKRLERHNETCPYDYLKAQEIYLNNVRRFYDGRKTLELDTTELPIDECITLIIKKLQEVLKENEC